jgi:hypothetical protein
LTLTFLLAVLLGGTVRFIGIGFDLPLITHPDEPKVVDAVIDLIDRRSFEPREFTWPAHIVIMMGYLVSNVYSYLVLGMGPETALNVVGVEHWYLSTRIGVAIFGTAGIVLAYAIGARLKREIGVVAAVLVAFFPIFVHDSHLATTDVVLSVAVMAVILGAMVYLDSPRYPALVAMSFFTAFAIATKYPGLIAAGMIAMVVGIRAVSDKDWRRFIKHGVVSLFALAGSLFIISPALFTRRHMVFRSVGNENKVTHLGADGLGYFEKLAFYWSQYYGATGWLLLVPFIIGLVAIIRFRLVSAVPLFTGAIFWLVLSALALHWTRWGMPMYVTPLLVSAVGVYYLFDAVSKKLSRFRSPVTATLVAVSVVTTANMIANSVAISAGFLVTDTRAIATKDFERLGITEDNSVYEGYTVHNTNAPWRVFQHFEEIDGQLVPLENDFHYVVISSEMYSRYMADPKYVGEQRFYEILENTYPLIVEYSARGHEGSLINPITTIALSVSHLLNVAAGESTKGPTIKVFAVPDEVRRAN